MVSATIDGRNESHSYDDIGNAVHASYPASTNDYTSNCRNQYSSIVAVSEGTQLVASVSYAPNGNMTRHGEWTYAYDSGNRLVSVASNGITVATMSYDTQGRRVKKVAADGTHRYFYDGWLLVYEHVVRPNNTTNEVEYVWGRDVSGTRDGAAGIGGLLYQKHDGAIYVPWYDAYGNILGYRDAQGNVVASYTYDAFGNIIGQSGTMADTFVFRFSTKYFDADCDLYYYGYRHYKPQITCWLTEDPIGEDGGMNLYEFVENNPMAMFDPFGEAVFMVLVGKRSDHSAYESILAEGKRKIDIVLAYLDKMPVNTYECLRKAGRVTFDGKRFDGTLSQYKKKIKREKQTVMRVTATYDETVRAVSSLSKKATESYDWFGLGMHGRLSPGNKAPVLVGFSDRTLVQKEALSSIPKKISSKSSNVLIVSCYQTWRGKTLKDRDRDKFREYLDPVCTKYTFTVSGPQARLKFTPFKLIKKVGKQ